MKLLTALTFGIASLMAAAVVLLAPLIIQLVYGHAFEAAIPILRIYTLYVPIATLYAIVQNHLITANRTRMMIVIGAAGASANIALNVLLIPSMGAVGASIATIIAGGIMIFIPFIARRRHHLHA